MPDSTAVVDTPGARVRPLAAEAERPRPRRKAPPGPLPSRPDGFPALEPWRPFGRPTTRSRAFHRRLREFPYLTAGIVVLQATVFVLMLLGGFPGLSNLVLPGTVTSPGLAQAFASDEVARGFGYVSGELLLQGEWWRLVAAAWLHGGIMHLGLNAAATLFLGRMVENFYGAERMLGAYLLSALGSSSLSALIGDGAALGASGAVMGLMGVVLVFGLRERERIPREVVDFFTWFVWFFAAVVILFGFGINLLLGGIVDNWGHIGGMITGVVVALFLQPRKLVAGDPPQRPVGRLFALGVVAATLAALPAWMESVERISPTLSDPQLNEARRELSAGDAPAALRTAGGRFVRSSGDTYTLLLAYDTYSRLERWREAVAYLDQALLIGLIEAGEDPIVQNHFAWSLLRGAADRPEAVARARALGESALEAVPNSAAILNTVALARYLDGELDGALRAIDRSIELRGGMAAGREEADERALPRLFGPPPSSGLEVDVFLRAIILWDLGRHAEARRLFSDSYERYEQGELRDEARIVIREGRPYPRAGLEAEAEVAGADADPVGGGGELGGNDLPEGSLRAEEGAAATDESAPADPDGDEADVSAAEGAPPTASPEEEVAEAAVPEADGPEATDSELDSPVATTDAPVATISAAPDEAAPRERPAFSAEALTNSEEGRVSVSETANTEEGGSSSDGWSLGDLWSVLGWSPAGAADSEGDGGVPAEAAGEGQEPEPPDDGGAVQATWP